MSDIFTDYLEGVAAALVTAGAGVYRTSGAVYSKIASETGIALRAMPADYDDMPDRMIVLDCYQTGAGDPFYTLDGMRLQARTRGSADDPRDEMAVRGLVYNALNGLRDIWFGTVHLSLLWSISGGSLGFDDRGRPQYSTNFDSTIDIPPTALRS